MIPAFAAAPYVPLTSADWDDRFTKALLVSAILHVLIVFGAHFKAANPRLFENTMPPLDVVLVNAKSEERPLDADGADGEFCRASCLHEHVRDVIGLRDGVARGWH